MGESQQPRRPASSSKAELAFLRDCLHRAAESGRVQRGVLRLGNLAIAFIADKPAYLEALRFLLDDVKENWKWP